MVHNYYDGHKTLKATAKSVFVLFYLILYVTANNYTVMSGQVFLGGIRTTQGLMCLPKGHNPVTLVRFKRATPRSRIKHSTTVFHCKKCT